MAKEPSKKKSSRWLRKISRTIKKSQAKLQDHKTKHVKLHKSFRRSYREDYQRATNTPGLLHHAVLTFELIFKNWRVFLPLVVLMVVLYIVLVGLLDENVYQNLQQTINDAGSDSAAKQIGNFAKAGLLLISTVATGGFSTQMNEAQSAFLVLLFLTLWLVTIYIIRYILSGQHPRLRDALYNALSPLIPTLLIFLVIFIQAIPLMLVVITYSSAVSTGFLSTPFYALVYFIFAALMILLSVYLLSSSLIALTAVTAPGIYPLVALSSASDLLAGRRIKFIIRLIYLIFVVSSIYFVVMLPIILIDLWLKSAFAWLSSWPIVPFCLLLVTCFVFVYATVYIYRYYRWLLDDQEKLA